MSSSSAGPGATSSSDSHAFQPPGMPSAPRELDPQLFDDEVLSQSLSMDVIGETADELTSSPPSRFTAQFQDVLHDIIDLAYERARLEARPATASSSVFGAMDLSTALDELEPEPVAGSPKRDTQEETALTETEPPEAEPEIVPLARIQTGTLSPELEAQLRPDTAGGLLEDSTTIPISEGNDSEIEYETDTDDDSLDDDSSDDDGDIRYFAHARRYRSKRQKVTRAIRAVKQAPAKASASVKKALLGDPRWSDSPYFLYDEYQEHLRNKGLIERIKTRIQAAEIETITDKICAKIQEPFFRRSSASRKECIACTDTFIANEICHLDCNHQYCEGCMKIMVMTASLQESTMPPKCCSTNIRPGVIKRVLKSDEEQIEFSRRVIEYETAVEKRLFCPKRRCGVFIPYHPFRDQSTPLIGTCQKCGTKACRICKEKAHKNSEDCPQDTGLTAILDLGKDHGWKRCYRCRAMIELNQGCNHMTCRCGAEFCYVCANPWSADYGCPAGCTQADDDVVAAMADEVAEQAGIGVGRPVDDDEAEDREMAARLEREAQAKRLIEERLRRTQEDLVMKALLRTQRAELQMFLRYSENVQFKLKQRHYEEMTDLQLDHVGQSLAHNGELEDRTVECSWAARAAEAEYCQKYNVSATEVADEETEHAIEIAALNAQYREEMLIMKRRWDSENAVMSFRHLRARENVRSIQRTEQTLTDAELLERKVTFITEQRHVLARMVELRTAITGQTYVSARALYDNIVSKDEDEPGLDEKLLDIAIADGLIEPRPNEATRYQSAGYMSPY
ncbi:hypothetical protein ABW21_db0207541 [Orbilia brochopaga]|nr:hypothetical protein ABW21_db0207541 [Drechslerella brochopaga]